MIPLGPPTMGSAEDARHFVLIAYEGWGLCRPLLHIATRLLTIQPKLYITFLAPGGFETKVKTELDRCSLRDGASERLKVVYYAAKEPRSGAGHIQTAERSQIRQTLTDALTPVIPLLAKGAEIPDSIFGQNVSTFSPLPTLFIVDTILASPLYKLIRGSFSADQAKPPRIFSWQPTSAAFVAWLHLYPKSVELFVKVLDRVQGGEKLEEAHREVVQKCEDVVEIPPCGPMRVFEVEGSCPSPELSFIAADEDHPDGMFINWPGELSQSIVAKGQDQYSFCEAISPFLVGPPLEALDHPVFPFLDRCLARFGGGSVLFISFGTWFYPPGLRQTALLLQVLDRLALPYVFLTGVADEMTKELIHDTVTSSNGRAFCSDWVPQYSVLTHEATGVFLTHGGSNSTMESIQAGKPMIFWPGGLDQTWIANELCRGAPVGVELIQIRQAEQVGRTTAEGTTIVGTDEAILEELQRVVQTYGPGGTDLERIQRNVMELKARLEADVQPGGKSYQALRRLAEA